MKSFIKLTLGGLAVIAFGPAAIIVAIGVAVAFVIFADKSSALPDRSDDDRYLGGR